MPPACTVHTTLCVQHGSREGSAGMVDTLVAHACLLQEVHKSVQFWSTNVFIFSAKWFCVGA